MKVEAAVDSLRSVLERLPTSLWRAVLTTGILGLAVWVGAIEQRLFQAEVRQAAATEVAAAVARQAARVEAQLDTIRREQLELLREFYINVGKWEKARDVAGKIREMKEGEEK